MKGTGNPIAMLMVAVFLGGCAEVPKDQFLPDARPLQSSKPLAAASDSQLGVTLQLVVVRNGPGSWVRDAYWDEYRFRVHSASGDEVRLERIIVYDALGRAIETGSTLGELVHATRAIDARYDTSVRDTAFAVVLGIASLGRMVFLPSPVHDSRIEAQIDQRQTVFPVPIGPSESEVVAFFPIVTLASAVELFYEVRGSARSVRMETKDALLLAHRLMDYRPRPVFPSEASRHGIDEGEVTALLSIDANGDVSHVQVVQRSSPVFVDEAKHSFASYKYPPGAERTVTEVIKFNRRER
jgi:hypothetical protein